MSMPKLVSKTELAEQLGVSVRSIERWVNNRDLPPPKRLGRRRVVWHADVIARWLDTKFDPKKEVRS
jgi:excisionase family DNA binding protein